MKRIIVLFRNDLRLHDQPALWAAANEGIVIPVFIKTEQTTGEASNWWLHHSLIELQKNLHKKELQLILKSGNPLQIVNELIEDTKADAIFFNECYEPAVKKSDRKLLQSLKEQGIEVQTFHGTLMLNPNLLLNKKGDSYKIFTSYYKRFMQETIPRPRPIPTSFHSLNETIDSLSIEELDLLSNYDWYSKLNKHWQPGENEAIDMWKAFTDKGINNYKEGRNFPSEQSVSNLSAHIAHGDISVRAILHSAKRQFETSSQADAFIRQLVWREFAYHQLIHFPTITHLPLRDQFKDFPWRQSDEQFHLWKKGLTGYPLVDAGMRELWATGIVHNRVRMVVASFLVKHLLLPWTDGAHWFEETLVDFDLANNSLGWQWVTGCGIDSAPYFRIFNPILQSEKFDKEGTYIKKWVPELAQLPTKYIHKPWEAPETVLAEADIELGNTYPAPMVDHKAARNRALEAFETTKKS